MTTENKPKAVPAPLTPAEVGAALDRAARRIAPLWPLQHFVAVNPYLGLGDQPFAAAAAAMGRAAGARLTMDRAFYAEAIAAGRIGAEDLDAALAEAPPNPGLPTNAAGLAALAKTAGPAVPLTPTVADVAGEVTRKDWSRFVTERVSAWAAGYFDTGQASWRAPWREASPYAAWRAEAMHDRTPEIMGLPGFRDAVAGLPATAAETVAAGLVRLGIPEAGLDAYLHRLAMTVGGWAAFARYQVWQSELYGQENATLAEFLAVRLAYDVAILDCLDKVAPAWARARQQLAAPLPKEVATGLAVDVLLQTAFDRSWQRHLVRKVNDARGEAAPVQRKSAQAALCIDVRSEVIRRAIESVDPTVETVGFAGFFGFPIEYRPLGHSHGGAQCPVLLTPAFTVRETVKGADANEETEALGLRMLRRRAGKAWKSFKREAVSSFGFVETMGLTFGAKLVTDAVGLTRTVAHPLADGLDEDVIARLAPKLEPEEIDGRVLGFAAAQRVAMGEAVLKAMSMTGDFARLVLLAGHGSTTVNNPHATGLDCGACGGHTGEANARVAAAVLNDPLVRQGLHDKGIHVPEDTVFLGGLHDTTTDAFTIFDRDTVPASHADDLAKLEATLAEAGIRARAERSRLLNLAPGEAIDPAVEARSHDWSQVRPEWGLAGCAAFVAAPRHRTGRVDLGGRSFLHSYVWQEDEGFGVLELIMTAPMVVASWISLQYYGSTVDNAVFGCGNKTLHNVVGTLGVLEGNAGDLRVGLPWQSVHDGEKLIHEPLRLAVVIEAPIEAMNAVIAKHEGVRQLLDNGWLFLLAMDASGAITQRYRGDLGWEPIGGVPSRIAA